MDNIRPIDAYALAEIIENLDITVAGNPARWNDAKYTVLKEIANAPTVDAVIPQCRIGDKVYFILDDDIVDDGEFICECTVTEVGSRGFWVSGSDPAEDDMSDFTPWDELGKTAFFSRSDAEKEYRKKCQ